MSTCPFRSGDVVKIFGARTRVLYTVKSISNDRVLLSGGQKWWPWEWFELVEAPSPLPLPSPKTCTCSMRDLLMRGCKEHV